MTRLMPLALGLVGLANAALWSAFIPPWQAPDEPKHMEYIRLLAESEVLVAFATEDDVADLAIQAEIIRSMDRHHFWRKGHAPGYRGEGPLPNRFSDIWLYGTHTAYYRSSPAYYWIAAQFQPADLIAGLYAARILSVLVAGAVTLLTALAAAELAPQARLVRIGAPLFVGLHPMFAFSHGSVNSDALANLVSAACLLIVARWFSRGASLARTLLIVALALAAIIVKRTAVFLLPIVVMGVVLSYLYRSARPRAALARIAVLAAVLSAILGTWLSAGGVARLPESTRALVLRYLFNEPDQPRRILAYVTEPAAWPVLAEYVAAIHNSFWGSFGWQVVAWPGAVQVLLGSVTVMAAFGVVRRTLRGSEPAWRRAALITYAAVPVLLTVAATAFFASYLYLPYAPPPQGRYLFAGMVAVAVVFMTGLDEAIPERWHPQALRGVFAALVALNFGALFFLALPTFYL